MADDAIATSKLYEVAFPFAKDIPALPVEDIDRTEAWYGPRLGLVEAERSSAPVPTVIMERDGVHIGFAVNGGYASNDGAAILVTDIRRARSELEARGTLRHLSIGGISGYLR